ncbi:hypothetical protein F5884DRAFT_802534 [Xylogone sp. PMI_703]|nr:hypothetical protein F5884DRAFT_802534 [Xylogone sp. PMI_703]
MKISQIYLYPVKSLCGISLQSATLHPEGLLHDRRYILLKISPKDGSHSKMWLGGNPEMALFHCSLSPALAPQSFTVRYQIPDPPLITPPPTEHGTTITIPFEPDFSSIENLEDIEITIEMYSSPTWKAYKMPTEVNNWFSACFGFPVILAYLGDGTGIPPSLSPQISSKKPGQSTSIESAWTRLPNHVKQSTTSLNVSDGGALLIVNKASLTEIHKDLPAGILPPRPNNESDNRKNQDDEENALLERFRPNIVLSGDEEPAWAEDFWAELSIIPSSASPSSPDNTTRLKPSPQLQPPQPVPIPIIISANCARCIAINVDLPHGKMPAPSSTTLLKRLMRDRRVDTGNKWSPVFGRYGFPATGGKVSVGDEIIVNGRNEKRDVWEGVIPRLVTFGEVIPPI